MLTQGSASSTGFHDMANVETWKCAICKQYDPVLPTGVEASKMPTTTEWVGCDCNRWYHQGWIHYSQAYLPGLNSDFWLDFIEFDRI